MQNASAVANSVRNDNNVESRENLHMNAIIEIKIPDGANEGFYPDGNKNVPFLQFCRSVTGGLVNFFLHSDDLSVRGKVITVSASVHKKTLYDGRSFLYVDLTPVAEGTPVKKRLIVKNKGDGCNVLVSHNSYRTPKPLGGVIIITDAGVKTTNPSKDKEMEKTAEESVPSTGDKHLDRLLSEGWQIESEDDTQVKLTKLKKGEMKTITHQRRKKKGK